VFIWAERIEASLRGGASFAIGVRELIASK
jgi:hypothetical protein